MSINSSEVLSDENLRRMAGEWYGYGWWESPFWFIGPEPGRPEKIDTLRPRCEAWIRLGRGELIDCKDHHFGFGWYSWHRETPRPPTQPTWRQLIRLLLALRGERPPDLEDIRNYQRCHWGMRKSEDVDRTCVIELCSLAAPAIKAKKNVTFDPNSFLGERIDVIRSRIALYRPKLVIMYGLSHTHQYQQVAGRKLTPGCPKKIGATCFVHTPAPTSRGLSKAYWLQLCRTLKKSGWLVNENP